MVTREEVRKQRTIQIPARVEGVPVVLTWVSLEDVYPTEDGQCMVAEFRAYDAVSGHTAFGRVLVGELLDEAVWIWAE